MTSLLLACSEGEEGVVKYLVKKGADAHVEDKVVGILEVLRYGLVEVEGVREIVLAQAVEIVAIVGAVRVVGIVEVVA